MITEQNLLAMLANANELDDERAIELLSNSRKLALQRKSTVVMFPLVCLFWRNCWMSSTVVMLLKHWARWSPPLIFFYRIFFSELRGWQRSMYRIGVTCIVSQTRRCTYDLWDWLFECEGHKGMSILYRERHVSCKRWHDEALVAHIRGHLVR